jgi:hypothetical protein
MTQSDDEGIVIEVNSARSLLDFENFATVWTALADPLVPVQRYGRVQPYKHRFDANVRAAFELFDKDRDLLFGNRDESFQGSIKRTVYGLNRWRFRIARKHWQTSWIAWFVKLCTTSPILYSRACSFAEASAKHDIVQVIPEGRIRSQTGASIPELYEYLPGVYWFTVFGRELTEYLDFGAVRSFTDLRILDLGAGQLALQLDSDPFTGGTELEERLTRETQIAATLGDDYFFDRDRTARALKQVPAFAATLEALKQTALRKRT